MKTILDPTKTRAILVGTSEFEDFNNIKSVENNLNEFAKVLENIEIFGLPKSNIKIIKALTDISVEQKIDEYIEIAKNEQAKTLIIYYSGHGFRNREGKYFLATKESDKNLIRKNGKTAISYDDIKRTLHKSGIDQKIILIDACYSGSAAQGDNKHVFEEYRTKGTYIITSSDSTELSYYDTDATFTIFTGELLDILKNGINNINQEYISLSELYLELKNTIKKKKKEMSPQKLSSKEITGSNFLFFKNKIYDKYAILKKDLKIQIEEADVYAEELNFEKAELLYARTLREAIPASVFSSLTEHINLKIHKITEIKKYKKIFENFYNKKDKIQISELSQKNKDLQELLKTKDDDFQKEKEKIAELRIKLSGNQSIINYLKTEIQVKDNKNNLLENENNQLKKQTNTTDKKKSNVNFSILNLGQIYEGGIIFNFDKTGKHGLICAEEDLGRFEWGCYDNKAGNTETIIGAGKKNSKIIIRKCPYEKNAINACDTLEIEGYDDWYLPSKDELNLMYINLHKQNRGNFENDNYWSSSEYSTSQAISLNFSDGKFKNERKYFNPKVRAIRKF